jgi:hypothetical protein
MFMKKHLKILILSIIVILFLSIFIKNKSDEKISAPAFDVVEDFIAELRCNCNGASSKEKLKPFLSKKNDHDDKQQLFMQLSSSCYRIKEKSLFKYDKKRIVLFYNIQNTLTKGQTDTIYFQLSIINNDYKINKITLYQSDLSID